VNNGIGQRIFTVGNRYGRGHLGAIRGHCQVICTLEKLNLIPGQYSLVITVGTGTAGPGIDTVNDAISFEVLAHDYFGTGRLPEPRHGVVIQDSVWKQVDKEVSSIGAP
jgi:hypothetical protein